MNNGTDITQATRILFNIINQLNVKVAKLAGHPPTDIDAYKQVRAYVAILDAYSMELTDLNDTVMGSPLESSAD